MVQVAGVDGGAGAVADDGLEEFVVPAAGDGVGNAADAGLSEFLAGGGGEADGGRGSRPSVCRRVGGGGVAGGEEQRDERERAGEHREPFGAGCYPW
jgi:hypothetical protein